MNERHADRKRGAVLSCEISDERLQISGMRVVAKCARKRLCYRHDGVERPVGGRDHH